MAKSDSELPRALKHNKAAGYFSKWCDITIFYDMSKQFKKICKLDPSLAFFGEIKFALSDLSESSQSLVARPAFSPESKDLSVIFGGLNWPNLASAKQHIQNLSGPFIVHRYEVYTAIKKKTIIIYYN